MRRRSVVSPLALLLCACQPTGVPKVDDTSVEGDTDTDTDTDSDTDTDGDGDGFAAADCDDTDPTVNPGADELCDGIDNDCSGTVDDNPIDGLSWYTDADGDAYGDPGTAVIACTQPAGTTSDPRDCDDQDPAVHPGAVELCDRIDQNCTAGTADEAGTALWIPDTGTPTDLSTGLKLGTASDPVVIGDSAGADYGIGSGTLNLCDGVWYAKLVVADPATHLTVVGLNGLEKTTLTTGGSVGSIIAVQNATVVVQGLTLTGGIGSDGQKGGAIAVEHTTGGAVPSTPNLTLEDCLVTNNVSSYGGAIAVLNYGWIELSDSLVRGNTASVAGGGAWLQAGGYVSCHGSGVGTAGFTDNTSAIGGAVYFSSSSAGGLLGVSCNWGDDAHGDDNYAYDIQRSPADSLRWCYDDATTARDTVSCNPDGCSGPTSGSCG